MTEFELLFKKLESIESRITPPKTWLDIRQASAYLQISSSQIRRLVSENQIPYRRIPNGKVGKLLFNRKVLDLWLFSGDVRPSKRVRQTFTELL